MNPLYLKEYHTFTQEDTTYLFNVGEMKAYRVSPDLAEEVDRLRQTESLCRNDLEDDLHDALSAMNLLSDTKPEKPTVETPAPEDVPVQTIALNVAQLCNLSCIYCYGVDGEYGQKGYMQDGTAKEAVDFLVANSGDASEVRIWFFGGEPLLNFDLIKETVAYAKESAARHDKGVRFSITTNGTRFDDEVNAFLNEEDFSVMVSFDGDPEMQNKNRPFKGGKGSYDKIRGKIESFLESRDGRAAGRATVTGYNADLQGIRDALREVGFHSVDAVTVAMPDLEVDRDPTAWKPEESAADSECSTGCDDGAESGEAGDTLPEDVELEGGDGEMMMELPVLDDASHRSDVRMIEDSDSHLQDEHIQKLLDDLEVLAYETLELIKSREPIYSKRFRQILSRLYTKSKKLYFCGVGRGLLSVSKSGDVYPCHRFVGQEDMKLGHVSDFDHDERESYVDNFGLSHPKCSQCWARYFCGGGCIHESIEANGVMYEPDDRWCQQLRRAVELSIFIYDHLSFVDRAHLGLAPKRTSEELMRGLGNGRAKVPSARSAKTTGPSGAESGTGLFESSASETG